MGSALSAVSYFGFSGVQLAADNQTIVGFIGNDNSTWPLTTTGSVIPPYSHNFLFPNNGVLTKISCVVPVSVSLNSSFVNAAISLQDHHLVTHNFVLNAINSSTEPYESHFDAPIGTMITHIQIDAVSCGELQQTCTSITNCKALSKIPRFIALNRIGGFDGYITHNGSLVGLTLNNHSFLFSPGIGESDTIHRFPTDYYLSGISIVAPDTIGEEREMKLTIQNRLNNDIKIVDALKRDSATNHPASVFQFANTIGKIITNIKLITIDFDIDTHAEFKLFDFLIKDCSNGDLVHAGSENPTIESNTDIVSLAVLITCLVFIVGLALYYYFFHYRNKM